MERYRWSLRAGTTGRGTVRVAVRKHSFEVGAPLEFDEEAAGISALEYALGALGAELVGGLQSLAKKRHLPLDQVEAAVSGELNDSLAALGVIGAEGHPGIQRIQVKVYVSSSAAEAELDRLWHEVLATSPLLRTLQNAATVEVTLQVEL